MKKTLIALPLTLLGSFAYAGNQSTITCDIDSPAENPATITDSVLAKSIIVNHGTKRVTATLFSSGDPVAENDLPKYQARVIGAVNAPNTYLYRFANRVEGGAMFASNVMANAYKYVDRDFELRLNLAAPSQSTFVVKRAEWWNDYYYRGTVNELMHGRVPAPKVTETESPARCKLSKN